MIRALVSAVAGLAALLPGIALGFQLAQWAAPKLCPAPNGPNVCALLGSFVIMGLVPLILSIVVGVVVWRAMAPEADNGRLPP